MQISTQSRFIEFPKRKSESGALFPEACLVIPLFFLFALAFYDFSRYIAARSLLNASAQNALAKATVIEGIEDTQITFDSAIAEIRNDIQNLVHASFVGYSGPDGASILQGNGGGIQIGIRARTDGVISTLPAPGPQQKRALETSPISVAVHGKFSPFLTFLPDFEIREVAVGYREPRSDVSFPVPTDCNGRPSTHPAYNLDCPCNDPLGRASRDPVTRTCQCPRSMMLLNDGSCGCPTDATGVADLVIGPDGMNCMCEGPARHNFNALDLRCECRGDRLINEDGSCGDCNPDGANPIAYGDWCVPCTGYHEAYQECIPQNRWVVAEGEPGSACTCTDQCSNHNCFTGQSVRLEDDQCACRCDNPLLTPNPDTERCECQRAVEECTIEGKTLDQETCECTDDGTPDEIDDPGIPGPDIGGGAEG